MSQLNPEADYTLVVNAGGGSKRMGGRHKALLPVPPNHDPLIIHMLDRLAGLSTADVVIVTNEPAIEQAIASSSYTTAKIVSDYWREAGAKGGIATGLLQCRDWAVVVACDMPFVNARLFEMLCQISTECGEDGQRQWDAVVPRIHGFPQMLHTLYHVDMLKVFEGQIQGENLKLLDVLRETRVRFVGEEELATVDRSLRSFTNVNTPDEWNAALRELEMNLDE